MKKFIDIMNRGTKNCVSFYILFMTGSIFFPGSLLAQSVNQNYKISNFCRISGINDDASLKTAVADKSKVQTLIEYVDGLGRETQNIQLKASPLGYDIVVPYYYDQYNREIRSYLPYVPTTGTAGNFRTDALSGGQTSFYNSPPAGVTQIPSATQSSYGEVKLESSPLGRIVETGAPGLNWKVGGGHTATNTVSLNTSADAVKLWTVSASGGASNSTVYAAGTLIKNIETDESGTTTISFADVDGKIICRKVQSSAGAYVVTDYIYDDLGYLNYIIPPALTASGTNIAITIPSSFTESNSVFLNYFYAYHYDDLGRQTEKKIPGQGWQYTVFNSKDQPVMSQDANQKALGIWMVIKYDVLGRVVMTGELTSAASRASLQASVDASTNNTYEAFTNVGTNYGYTHVSYPDISPGTGKKVLSVFYFDNYDIVTNTSVNPGSSVFTAPSAATDSLDKVPRGYPVATLTNILGTNNYMFSLTHYNKDGRAVRTTSQNFQGGILAYNKFDTEENQYGFQGVVSRTTRKHYLPASSNPVVTIITTPSYDHMNRQILKQQQYITPTVTGGTIAISRTDYNELGQLKTKHLHSTASGMPAGSAFLQHIDYRYNSRGWLSRINNASSTLDETFPTQLDVFGENLDYDQVTNGLGGSPQYNGNLSNVKWQTKWPATVSLTQEYKGYVFTYDAQDRLKNAQYKAQTTSANGSYDESVNYDELGNILTFTRNNGPSTLLNNMTYNYMDAGLRGNRLIAVTDPNGTEGFTPAYTYNSNGSLLTDTKKTISGVVYNELGLPSSITITTGSKVLKNVYAANGKKLQRLIIAGGVTSEDRYYIDGIEYAGGSIEFIKTPEGRALPSSGGYILEYGVKDHIGNVRSVFGDKNNDGVLTSDEIVQTNDFYAFGRSIAYSGGTLSPSPDNAYKYNGKELQKDIGEYDFGMRFYDPVIGRWTTIDPQAESSTNFNPYAFSSNNPMNQFDPDGLKDKPFNEKTDKGKDIQPNTATPLFVSSITRQYAFGKQNASAYNCHSYAWEDSKGDPCDLSHGNAFVFSIGAPRWDNDPSNNIKDSKAVQLDFNDPNVVGDRVIYYQDANGNGKWDVGEIIDHSAKVTAVDKDGNTTLVKGKLGQDGISENHPNAPGYYNTYTTSDGRLHLTSRAYFRLPKTKTNTGKGKNGEQKKTNEGKSAITASAGLAATSNNASNMSWAEIIPIINSYLVRNPSIVLFDSN